MKPLIIIKGAGDLATGVAHKLFQCGFAILMLETPEPTVIRRTVAFAEAVYEGKQSVEGVTAVLATDTDEIPRIIDAGSVAVLVDPHWKAVQRMQPLAVVDAIIAKRNLGTVREDAPITIGLGPGFTAGHDVGAVIETQRGHNLGRVLYQGSAADNTGEPGVIAGYGVERLLRSPVAGKFMGVGQIGDMVSKDQVVARVGEQAVYAPITGVLRGMLRSGIAVSVDFKVGDIDPRGVKEYCFTISDKARSVAGGVLEALMYLRRRDHNG